MTTTNQTILRLYCKQILPNGDHYLASDAEVLQTTMDYASETGIDIDDAARSLELAAQRFEVSTNELVAAVTCLAVYVQCRLGEALWQLERVVNVVRQVEPAPEVQSPPEDDEYDRLVAFTRLLSNVAEALRLKGRTEAADIVHAEAVHFATERDIAKAMADADLDTPGATEDLGRLDE